MKKIIKAKYYQEYKIKLIFSDNTKNTVDLSKYLWGEIFEPLKNIENFKKFKIDKDFGVLSWYNGADLAIENLV